MKNINILSNSEQTFLGSILYFVKNNYSDLFDETKIDYLIDILIQRGITIPVIDKNDKT